jgi:hypothetical protein
VIRSKNQITSLANNVNGRELMDTNVKGAERTLAHLSMFLWFGIMLLYFENNGTMKALKGPYKGLRPHHKAGLK